MLLRIAVILALCSSCFGQAWNGVLTSARAVDWTYAGVPGGVPSGSWTQCGSTISSGASTATIQTALNNCTAGHYVLLGAGNFTLTTSLHAQTSQIALRGSGPTQTFVHENSGANILMGNGTSGQGSYPTGLSSTNISGSPTQGITVLTVASTTGLSAGQTVVIDQHNAAWVYTTGVEGPCTSGNSCGRNDSPLQFNGASTRAQQEMVLITNVNSGANQITIAAPGLGHDYSSGLTPQVFFWSTPNNVQYMGVENMSIDVNDNDHAISFPFCDYCWVKNLSVTNATNHGAVFFFWSYRDEIRDSYFGGGTGTGHPRPTPLIFSKLPSPK